jgi:hypothetical protein
MTSSTHDVTEDGARDDDKGGSPRADRESSTESSSEHEDDLQHGPGTGSGSDRRTRPWWAPGPVVGLVVVAVLAALGLVAGLVLSSRTPKLYSSNAVIRVYNPYRLSGSQFGQVDPVTIVNLERQYADSKALQKVVDSRLDRAGVVYDHTVWTSQPDAATVTVRCFAKAAVASSTCAQQYADTYVATRASAISGLLNKQNATLGVTLARLNKGVASLQSQLTATSTQSGSDRNRGLLAQQDTLLSQIEQLTITRQQVQAQSEILSGNYQIVTPARTPNKLTTPYTLRNAGAGLGLGLLLGLALYLALSSAGVRRSRTRA